MAAQSAAEFYAQLSGTVEALVLALGSVVSVLPSKEQERVAKVVNQLLAQAVGSDSDNAQTRSYKAGMRSALESLVKSIETARLAADVQQLKKTSGSH